MKKKKEGIDTTGETLTEFWKVGDMFTFENVGFSNTVNKIKYFPGYKSKWILNSSLSPYLAEKCYVSFRLYSGVRRLLTI